MTTQLTEVFDTDRNGAFFSIKKTEVTTTLQLLTIEQMADRMLAYCLPEIQAQLDNNPELDGNFVRTVITRNLSRFGFRSDFVQWAVSKCREVFHQGRIIGQFQTLVENYYREHIWTVNAYDVSVDFCVSIAADWQTYIDLDPREAQALVLERAQKFGWSVWRADKRYADTHHSLSAYDSKAGELIEPEHSLGLAADIEGSPTALRSRPRAGRQWNGHDEPVLASELKCTTCQGERPVAKIYLDGKVRKARVVCGHDRVYRVRAAVSKTRSEGRKQTDTIRDQCNRWLAVFIQNSPPLTLKQVRAVAMERGYGRRRVNGALRGLGAIVNPGGMVILPILDTINQERQASLNARTPSLPVIEGETTNRFEDLGVPEPFNWQN